MVSAIRQTVTVESEGKVEVHSPELRAGAKADVIVLIEEPQCQTTGSLLEVLDALQAGLQLTAPAAVDWVRQARAEREAIGQ